MDFETQQWGEEYAHPFMLQEKYPPEAIILRADQYEQEETDPSAWPGLDFSGNGLTVISPSISNFTHLKSLYLLNNNLTTLPPQLFTGLVNLTLIDVSNNQVQELPPEIENLQHLQQLILTNNNISVLPPEMGRLWRLSNLQLSGNRISSPPSSIVNGGTQKIIFYLRDSAPLIPPLPPREWRTPQTDQINPQQNNKNLRFKVFSYNVLAESYATEEQHPYTPKKFLAWDWRKNKILEQIIESNSDIICLQEVEGYQFQHFFLPQLQQRGYDGIHKLKTRAKTMSDPGNVDGCSIFFRTSKFRLEDKIDVEYQGMAIKNIPTGPGLDRTIRRDNVGLIAILQVVDGSSSSKGKNSTKKILVCNTHIHWDPTEADVKLMQVQFLLEELENVCGQKNDPNLPVIIAGDFNSEPTNAVYQLLKSGNVNKEHKDWNNTNYGKYSTNGCSHKFNFRSCFDGICEPEFSNFNGDFMGVLDYIWYTNDSFRVLGASVPHSKEQIVTQKSPLPNSNYPSDHIYLLTELELTKKSFPR